MTNLFHEVVAWFSKRDPLGFDRSVIPIVSLYVLLFAFFYGLFGKQIGPFHAIAPNGNSVMNTGLSGTFCRTLFTAALFVGLAWSKNYGPTAALPATALTAATAAGIYTLGYSVYIPHAGLLLTLAGALGIVIAKAGLHRSLLESFTAGFCTAMTASFLMFVCLTAGLVSMTPPSEGLGAVSWEEVSMKIQEGAKALGVENVSVRLAPLPMGESASYSTADNIVAVSVTSFLAEDADGESIVSDAVVAIEEGMVQTRNSGSLSVVT